MSVNVNGEGSLFTSIGIDVDSLEADLKAGFDTAISQAQKFENSLINAATTGKTALVSAFQEAVKVSEQIAPLIEKGLSNLDPGKLSKLSDEVESANSEFEILQKTIDFVSENLGEFNLNPEELEQLRGGVEKIKGTFEGLSFEQKSVMSQLRDFKNTLATQPSNPFFNQMLKDAATLQERLKVVQQELKLASSNAPALQATGQAVRGLVAGFQALHGALVLVSGNNEDVEKTTQSLIASMSILNGINEVMAILEKDSALNVFLTAQSRKMAAAATTEQAFATEALAAAEGTQAVATEGAAIAQQSLNTAMKLNPAGLLLTGLTAVVGAIQFFTSRTKDATEETKRFNLELGRIGKDANQLIKDIKSLTEYNNEAARSRGSVESQITGQTINGYKDQVFILRESLVKKQQLARTYYSDLTDLSNVYIGNLEDAEKVLNGIENVIASPTFSDFTKPFQQRIEFGKEVISSIVDDYRSIKDIEQEIKVETQRRIQQQLQEALRSAAGYAEAALLLSKRNTEEELKAQLSAIKARASAELNSANLTSGERARILAQAEKDTNDARQNFRIVTLNDERAFVEEKLAIVKEGSAEELALRIELIQKTKDIELAEAGLTEGQIAKIKAERAKEILELNKEFNAQLKQDEIETRISTIAATLAVTKEGTDQELKLKIQLAEQQAQLEIARANEQIKNEERLQAKIQEILATAMQNRKRLEEDYVRNFLTRQFEQIKRQTDVKNDKAQRTIDDIRSNSNEKYSAQLEILANNLQALQKQQELVSEELRIGKGNCDELTKSFEDLQREIDKTNDKIDQLRQSKFGKDMKQLADNLFSISGSLGSLANSLREVNPELSDMFENLSDITGIAGNVVSSFASFSTGDIVSGIQSAVKAIEGIVKGFAKAKESAKAAKEALKEFQANLIAGEQEYNALLRERERQLLSLNKISLKGIKDQKALLEQQKQTILQSYNDILEKLQNESYVAGLRTKKKRGSLLGGLVGFFSGTRTEVIQDLRTLAGKSFEEIEKLFLSGQLTDNAKKLFEQLRAIKEEGLDIDRLLAENAQTLKEALTGTNADNITQSIIDGFRQGLRSARDFATTFKELMQNALLQSLQLKYLEAPLQDFFNEFASLSESGDQLTSSEVNQLQEMFNTIITTANQQFEQLQQVSGINFSSATGPINNLTGAIKGITEQQAELLAGQFGGLRITALDALAVSRQQLNALNAIQVNTGASAVRLQNMIDKLIYYYEVRGVKVY
jgi:hypothetical protein